MGRDSGVDSMISMGADDTRRGDRVEQGPSISFRILKIWDNSNLSQSRRLNPEDLRDKTIEFEVREVGDLIRIHLQSWEIFD